MVPTVSLPRAILAGVYVSLHFVNQLAVPHNSLALKRTVIPSSTSIAFQCWGPMHRPPNIHIPFALELPARSVSLPRQTFTFRDCVLLSGGEGSIPIAKGESATPLTMFHARNIQSWTRNYPPRKHDHPLSHTFRASSTRVLVMWGKKFLLSPAITALYSQRNALAIAASRLHRLIVITNGQDPWRASRDLHRLL